MNKKIKQLIKSLEREVKRVEVLLGLYYGLPNGAGMWGASMMHPIKDEAKEMLGKLKNIPDLDRAKYLIEQMESYE